jgi:enoyl-CoA hydratase
MGTIGYDVGEPGIARITLTRPEKRNAQNPELLYALDDAFTRAVQDSEVRVIVLDAEGPDFSSGHDLRADWTQGEDVIPRTPVERYNFTDVPGHLAAEEELFTGLCLRWRDLPKPTIAQVQGRVIAGGLMLIWPCDLIVASEDATFSDPVAVFGVNGHEYFTHLWELGHRRAKELLFTGEPMTAAEALKCGMVNRVVPREQLAETTLGLARTIAGRPAFAHRLAKRSINHALDLQGQRQAVEAALAWHHVGHANQRLLHGGKALDAPDRARPKPG